MKAINKPYSSALKLGQKVWFVETMTTGIKKCSACSHSHNTQKTVVVPGTISGTWMGNRTTRIGSVRRYQVITGKHDFTIACRKLDEPQIGDVLFTTAKDAQNMAKTMNAMREGK